MNTHLLEINRAIGAQAAMVELMPYIDVIIGTEEAYDVMNGGSARVKR